MEVEPRFLATQSDLDAFKARADQAIEELINLKKTREDLQSNLRALNAKRDDVKRKRSQELQRGKDIRQEVENWLREVERIEKDAQENEGKIQLLCKPENIVRIVVASSSKTSSSNKSESRNVSIFGMGGAGNTSIHAEGSTISTNIGKVETTHHHYYHEKK